MKMYFVMGLAIVAFVMAGAYEEETKCTARGGKRLRATWFWQGGFQCYDAGALKVLVERPADGR